MFHHEDRVARIHETLKHCKQLPDVGHVETRCGFIQNVERTAGGSLGQLARELHSLRFPARKRRRRLPQMQIIQAHIAERFQLASDVGRIGKELPSLADFHVQEFCNVLPLPSHLQRVFGKPGTSADFARHPHIGQKIHVQSRGAIALASLAATASHVEAKPPRLPAPLLRLRQHREQRADVVPDFDVGGWIAAGRTPNRRLIDDDDFIELVGASHGIERAGLLDLAAESPPQFWLENVAHQRTLAAPRHARHADQQPQRNLDIDSLQVVVPHPLEPEIARSGPSLFCDRSAAFLGHYDRIAA